MRNIRLYLDLTIVVLIVIGLYISSSQPYGQQDMRGSIERYLGGGQLEQRIDNISWRYAGKEISAETVGFSGLIEFLIRKATHFLTFWFLTVFLYRLLRHFCSPAVAIPWSGLSGIGIAILDEWHQTFTPDRTGMVTDVLLDASGVFVALLCIAFMCVVYHNFGRTKSHNKHRGHRI